MAPAGGAGAGRGVRRAGDPAGASLLNARFGFVGVPGAGPNALAAPQAALISTLAQGVLGGQLDWSLIGIGAAIGAVVIVIDEVLRKTGKGMLPPLALGMGIYLPMALTLFIPIGALIGHSMTAGQRAPIRSWPNGWACWRRPA
jgi:putative OPT family oligopeptide transporter